MMGSRLANETKTSIKNNLEEHETLPLSSNKLKCNKNKSSFQSPVVTKQLKTDPEIKHLSKKRDKSEDDSVEEKENTLRRSKRRKNYDSNIESEKTTPMDIKNNFKNDAKGTEVENLCQNHNVNVLPENVMKILDKELFPEGTNEEQNLNNDSTEAMVEEKQLVVSTKEKNETVTTKVDNTALVWMEVDYDTRSERNFLQIHDEIKGDNKSNKEEINTNKEKIEQNNTRDMSNQELLQTSEIDEKYERNIKTKSLMENGTNDSSLDLLNVDIKKADDIIISLITPENDENSCPISGDTMNISNSKFHSSENNSMDGSSYIEQDKSLSEINPIDTLSKSSFQSKLSTSSKHCQIITDDQQQSSLENVNYIKYKQSEQQDGTSNCSNNHAIEEENNEANYNSLINGEANHFNDNAVICEDMTAITKILQTHDSSEGFNNQISSKSNTNIFPVANGDSHENNDFNNSQSSNIQTENSHIEINDSKESTDKIKHPEENLEIKQKKLSLLYMSALDYEKKNEENEEQHNGENNIVFYDSKDSTDKIKHSEENLEMKQKKLTLLYMSALDYEKEDEENGEQHNGENDGIFSNVETVEKSSEIGNESIHSDAGDESTDNDIFVTPQNIEMPKQNLNDLSKGTDKQSTETTQELHSHQNINESRISNEKEVLEDAQGTYEGKKDMLDLEKANQITNDITTNEQHNSNDSNPIKCDLICCKETNKEHNFQEHFVTLKFHDNMSLSETSSYISENRDKANFNAADSKNGETKKWYKSKRIHEADTTFIETTADYFKSEQNENLKIAANDKKDKNMDNSDEDNISHKDIDESFDMDDDFNLTASQINMIEVNESNQYKESNKSKSGMKTENCNDTHFGQDSITVEIMDQLCYIRESVDSIKELLKTFMKKNDGKE